MADINILRDVTYFEKILSLFAMSIFVSLDCLAFTGPYVTH